MLRPAASFVAVLVLSFTNVFLGSCQRDSPQNIETFYPYAPPRSPVPLPSPSPSPVAVPPPPSPPFVSPPPPLFQPPPPPKSSSSDNNTIVKAVLGTAAGSIAISGLVFFLVRWRSKKKQPEDEPAGGGLPVMARDDFRRFDGNVKGLIVDENGLDVLYWRKLQSGNARNGFRKEVMRGREEEGQDASAVIMKGSRRRNSDPIQEVPLLREKPRSTFSQIQPLRDVEMSASSSQLPLIRPPPPLPPPPPPPPPPTPGTSRSSSPELEVRTALAIPSIKSESPSPPPPPPPPPPAPKASNTRAPPPPPPPKASNARAPPPPPPPKASSSAPAAPKVPPTLPKGELGEPQGKNHLETGQVKLKPLHWDKVNTNTDHSMVWNKIGRGSFQ